MWLRRVSPPVWADNIAEAFAFLHDEGGASFNLTLHPWSPDRRIVSAGCARLCPACSAADTSGAPPPTRWHASRASSCNAATQAQLRILRQKSSAARDRRPHLQLRVHVLRPLRRDGALRRLSELRRRIRAAAHPTGCRTPPRRMPRQAACVDRAYPPEVEPHRAGWICWSCSRHQTRRALKRYCSDWRRRSPAVIASEAKQSR